MLKTIKTIDGYELLTIQQASQICGVTVRTVHNWIVDGRLEVLYKAGRLWMVDKKAVETASNSYQKTKPRSRNPKEIEPDDVAAA